MILLLLASLAFLFGVLAPNHYYPWGAYYNDLPMLAVVVFVFFAALPSLKRLPSSVLCPLGFTVLIVLATIPWLQFFSGQVVYLGDAWVASLYLAGAGLVYGVVAALINGGQLERNQLLLWLASVGFAAALISGWIGLRQVFIQSGVLWEVEIPSGARPVGNLAQSNQLATLLLLGVMALAYLFLKRIVGIVGFVLASFSLGLMLAAAQSRSALLAQLLYIALMLVNLRRCFLRGPGAPLILMNAVCVLLWFAWPWFYAEWSIQSGMGARSISDPFRIAIAMQMLAAIRMAPWLGYGWQQVSMAQVSGASSFPSSIMIESSHNLFLDLLLWNGVVLGGGLCLIIVVWFIRSVRVAKCDEDWYALAFLLVLLTHAMFEYPLQYAYFLLPAAAMAASFDVNHALRRVALPKACLVVLFAVCLIGGLGVAWEYPAVERAVRQLRFETMGINGLNVRGAREESKSIVVLSQLKAYVDLATTQVYDGMSDSDLERMREAAHRYPYKPALMKYAFALGVNRKYSEAEIELNNIRSIHGGLSYKSAMAEILRASIEHPQLLRLLENKSPCPK